MARAPAAAEAPAQDEMMAPDVATDVAMEEEAAAGEPVVVATILRNADGSFTLKTGDEGEPGEGMGGMGGMMDEGGEPMAPAGQTFAPDEGGIGQLMTAVLDLVDPENAGGAQAKANFDEGFGGPTPPAPTA